MKSRISRSGLAVLLLLFLFLQSCNLPIKSTKSTPTEPVLTVAARTVSAQLTLDAPQTTPIPQLGSSATPTTANFFTATATRAHSTLPPVAPTNTSVPSSCDASQFIADVTIPDNTSIVSKHYFTKTWQVKNTGTCTWSTSYGLQFIEGNQMSTPTTYTLSAAVVPGKTLNISLKMKAPSKAGTYKSVWKLKNASGVAFGESFYVQIVVIAATATSEAALPSNNFVYIPGQLYPWSTPVPPSIHKISQHPYSRNKQFFN